MRIHIAADHDAPFTAMFEPEGMTYELAGGERMIADVETTNRKSRVSHVLEMSVLQWKGGVSIWAPGVVDSGR